MNAAGGERKARRMESVMQAMDDRQGGEAYEDGPIRQSLVEASPIAVTLEGIRGLFQQEMAPVKNSIAGLEKKMTELSISADDHLKGIDVRLDRTEARMHALENMCSGAVTPESEGSRGPQISMLVAKTAEEPGADLTE